MFAITQNLQAVRAALSAACAAATRAENAVQLLAVSKTFDYQAVLTAAHAGQRAFGENYLQEALEKQAQVSAAEPALALEWHFIGPIQSNKTRPIAEHFAWVHTVERLKIAERLSSQRPPGLPPLNVCIQVNISNEASKSGCSIAEVTELAQAIAHLPNLRLRGLMAIPAPALDGSDESVQRAPFAQMRQLFTELQTRLALPDFDTLSMGMSADMHLAIAEGATMVRVGSAIFGARQKAVAPSVTAT